MIEFFITHIEVVGVILLTLGVAFILLQQRRSPQSTAAWILFLVVMPYVAAPLFLALGFRKQGKRYEPIIFYPERRPANARACAGRDVPELQPAPRAGSTATEPA